MLPLQKQNINEMMQEIQLVRTIFRATIFSLLLMVMILSCKTESTNGTDNNGMDNDGGDVIADSVTNSNDTSSLDRDAFLNDMNWLEGLWKKTDSTGTFFEKWIRGADGNYTGINMKLRNGDTAKSEKMMITKLDTNIYFIITIPGMNNDRPIYYSLIYPDPENLIFQNKNFTFPEKIYYVHMGDSLGDSIRASAEGVIEKQIGRDLYVYLVRVK